MHPGSLVIVIITDASHVLALVVWTSTALRLSANTINFVLLDSAFHSSLIHTSLLLWGNGFEYLSYIFQL
ncbi:hypothetical protein BDV37DRAFT_240066 [Aspergillus pseudonomiae]|uniref:Uncharacterized protein n=1 Tax=Aspergillus pseudonomiae TaxID=1506151 RepID=A0A5N7DMV0_9EURO|nr:uncharacterized protein BDV37DRAFT_240066 [Aspergillus pseudonomiae]KAE8407772.1 hypothetical protein BDV37DRAFT_240066 [Aspergillus pseudonomiae]